MRPYDLDEHVRRFIERDRRRRAQRTRAADIQLGLFDPTPWAVGRPARYEGASGLVVDDEMLFARCVHLHSAQKAFYARSYADIVATAMKKRWKLWWVELFAGPGRLYVHETGEFVPGSPLETLSIKRPFHGHVFCDFNPACTESLRRRIGEREGVHVIRGDANSAELLDQVAAIVPRNALVVLYGDPEGLDLDWKTVEFFVDRYKHLDLLLNLPTEGVVRALAAGYEEKAARLLDHPHPQELLATSRRKGVSILEWYERRLRAVGFDQFEHEPVKITGRNRDLYELVLASRISLAPKFFAGAVKAYRRRREQIAA